MASLSTSRTTLWTLETPVHLPLTTDAECDVCVIGAGLAGLTTACLLASEGLEVIVLDRGGIGTGETTRHTAHVGFGPQLLEVLRLHGHDDASRVVESHAHASDLLESLCRQVEAPFEHVDGFLWTSDRSAEAGLDEAVESLRKAGLLSSEVVLEGPTRANREGAMVRIARQAQLHPSRLLVGLARALTARGGRIFCDTTVTEVREGELHLVATERGPSVIAPAVVVATHSPIHLHVGIHSKQTPHTSYVLAARIPQGALPPGNYWNVERPGHFLRTFRSEPSQTEYLIAQGEAHKTGQANDAPERYAHLESWCRERFPDMQEVVSRWSTETLEPTDRLPFIGRSPGSTLGVFLATGFSMDMMAYGALSGLILRDLILGRANPWEKLYSPSRRTLKNAGEFIRENVNVVAHYSEWVIGATTLDLIAPGEGGVVDHHGIKVAAFRELNGSLHFRSPVCRHLGCIVHWNSDEKSWDCPCHGSRYDAHGKVLHGPAHENLLVVSEDVQEALTENDRRRGARLKAASGTSPRPTP